MGNSSSRNRDRTRPTTTGATAQQPNAPLPGPYPPPPVYNTVPPRGGQQYYGQGPYVNNGQMYGQWRPPFGQQYPGPGPARPPRAAVPPTGPPPLPFSTDTVQKTATIRNNVNLKKNTLRITPLSTDPTKLAVSFSFDASAPCSVTVFIVASELASQGCRLTPLKQPARPAIFYDKGLGLQFPPGGAEASVQSVVELPLYKEEQLTGASGDVYPLIIRLESITEPGKAEGHTLQELQPGSDQKVWVQSQTTFACLSRDEEAGWLIKVLKQKIWVEGVSYELQEIYGMEHHTGAANKKEDTEEDREERLCVICLVNDRDTTVLPCRHMCMCHECAKELRKQTSKCPICRNQVDSLLHIRMNQATTPLAE